MNRYNIGRRIEAYREKLGMSTQELAARIRRSQATISRIENGKQGLTFELLSRVAAELRVHPFALLSDEPPRASVLLPERDKGESAGGYTPNLLANALHGGRLRRHFRIETAAEMLGVSQVELEAVELAQNRPEDAFLDRVCDLYGLPVAEMRMLKQFGDAAPGMAKSLAHLQQVFSHIHHLIKCCPAGEERRVLDKIVELLDSSDLDHPLEPDASSDDVGLFLNRLSLHLVNALRDSDFRGKMFQMAGVRAEDGAGTRDPGMTERR